jgi:hypothetical protein
LAEAQKLCSLAEKLKFLAVAQKLCGSAERVETFGGSSKTLRFGRKS